MNPNNTLRQPSKSTGISIFYITVGILAAIWAAVWYFFLRNREQPASDWNYYLCAGLFFSGIALLLIGLLVGRIGQQARQADNPVGQVTAAAVTPEGTAPAATAPAATVPQVAVPAKQVQQS
jgi:hypothetical protein